MKSLKRLINRGIRKTGWQLKKIRTLPPKTPKKNRKAIPPRVLEPTERSTMAGALQWLGNSGIPIKTILDVGASNGSWSIECMQYLTATEYVLFEPQPVHEPDLEAFKCNSEQNITLIKKAVGSTEGVTFFHASDPFGGALSSVDGKDMIQVPVTTIDRVVQEHSLNGPFLLKLDTHGYEPSILTGAVETLEHCSVLIIEAYNFHITSEALLFWELCVELAKKGFRCVDVVDLLHRQVDSALWQMDIIFIRDNWNGFSIDTYAL